MHTHAHAAVQKCTRTHLPILPAELGGLGLPGLLSRSEAPCIAKAEPVAPSKRLTVLRFLFFQFGLTRFEKFFYPNLVIPISVVDKLVPVVFPIEETHVRNFTPGLGVPRKFRRFLTG